MTTNWGIVAACGPTDREIERVGDLLDSVFHYEPATRWVAIIDSGDEDRRLAERFKTPPGTTLVGIRNPKSGWAGGQWGPLCVGVLAAYEWIARHTDAKFVVKFDSDALVIAPFASKILHAMTASPDAAIFGSYRVNCNGQRRDWNGMAGLVRRLHQFALLEYEPQRFGRRFPLALCGRPAGMRRHIGHALRNGYEFGEHVSGGAYAATRELLDRMLAKGYLAARHVWADSQMSEDVMIGIYARACGLSIAGHANDGDVFGVKHIGLPDSPERLIERGYSIVHSVKSDPSFSEADIRAFMKQRRLDPARVTPLEKTPSTPAAAEAATPGRLRPTAQRPNDNVDVDDIDELALGL
jgi:hypothetical protein